MSHSLSTIGKDIGKAAAGTAAFFTGGASGANAVRNLWDHRSLGSNAGQAGALDLAGLLGGAGAASMMGGGAAAGGGASGDMFGGSWSSDPAAWTSGGGGDMGWVSAEDPYGLGLDQGNFMGGPGTVGAGDFGGGGGLGMGNIANYANLARNFLGRGGAQGAGGAGGGSLLNFLTGQTGGPSLPSLAPGLAALQYARQQKPIDTSQLQSVFDQAGANAPLFVQAAQHPLQQSQAGGYGDILQSQGLRGIRGSSFGDQSIANYLTDTNRGIADAGTNAAQAALGLQGELGGQISNLNALSQQMKNNLYGRAFSSLGQGLNPTPGIGGFGGMPQMGGGGFPSGGMPSISGAGGFLGNLGIGGIGNAFGNLLGNAGSGLGNLFGSPGSTLWSGPAKLPPSFSTSPLTGSFGDFSSPSFEGVLT